jgi:hypothetical protein
MIEFNDPAAIQTLTTIAQSRLAATPEAAIQAAAELDPSLRAALAATFGGTDSQPATEGELARAALDLLAEDPAYSEPIEVLFLQAER